MFYNDLLTVILTRPAGRVYINSIKNIVFAIVVVCLPRTRLRKIVDIIVVAVAVAFVLA